MNKPHWQVTALAIAAAVMIGVSSGEANALALGRITVQSALGEPLRAEIDIPEINAEELGSLRTNVAAPDVFKAAGIEYNPALTGLKIELARRADGRHFLRLTTTRAVNDPFIDLILETTWASGRVVRDYTLLLDPPSLRQQAQPLQAETAPAAAGRAAPPAPATRAPQRSTSRAPASAPMPSGDGKQVTVQGGDTAGKIAAANKPASVSLDQMLVAMLRANPDAFMGGNVNRLRSGAVLEVPSAEQAALVPTDEAKQTLVAQSRDFNEFRRRLAEGVPTARIAPSDRQVSGRITANVQEKKPSAASPDKLTLSKGSAAGGKGVEERIAKDRASKDSATRVAELNKNIADLNKLGKPGAAAPAAAGAATSASAPKTPGLALPLGTPNAAKPASAPAPAPAPVVAAAAAPKPASAPAPAPVVAPAPAVVAAASAAKPASGPPAAAPVVAAPASATAAVAAASAPMTLASAAAPSASATASAAVPAVAAASAAAPVASAPAPAPVAAVAPPKPAPKPEPGFVDQMLENPIIPGGIGVAILGLLGFGLWRNQQRKKATQVDSSFLESRLQPDSFFGASGGQRIDTNEGSATGSSMVYSPSQLDAAGDVDPVAEADVYLAYGRDLQAEEILKEALRTQPQRVAIHSKLLEIYAKRRDAKAFEVVAAEAYNLTHGQGPEWEHICDLGKELDPSNAMYQPGGTPSEGVATAAVASMAAGSYGATTVTQAVPQEEPASPDIDLDLDFSLGDDEPAAPAPMASAPVMANASEPTLTMSPHLGATQPMSALDVDFDGASTQAVEPRGGATEPIQLETPDLNIDADGLSFDLDGPPPEQQASAAPHAPAPASAKSPDDGMLEFDLGALSLDLPGSKPAAAAPQAAAPMESGPSTGGAPLSTGGFDDSGNDPLATKLALAQEFNAIGDPDGARTLAQEVVAEAQGDLKHAAQKFLAEIS